MSAVSLATEGTLPRHIKLVPGHTYHIVCQDTANTRQFDDDPTREVWYYNGSSVQSLLSPAMFPGEGVAAVYASTAVSMEANEWTLVLQQFGDRSGVYSCHGLDVGQSVSVDILPSKEVGGGTCLGAG